MFYTIGEAAKKLNIPPSTLRYYDREGLLPFVKRSGGGIRMFQDSDFEWLATIECLKSTGMSIRDIKAFIGWCLEGDSTIEKRLETIRRQQEAVMNQIAELKEHLDMLNYKRWYYETAKKAGTCSVHDHMRPEDIPLKFRKTHDKKTHGTHNSQKIAVNLSRKSHIENTEETNEKIS